MARLRLDPDACVGHGRCYALDPDDFAPDDMGHCELVRPAPPPDAVERARRAVEACPEGALSLED